MKSATFASVPNRSRVVDSPPLFVQTVFNSYVVPCLFLLALLATGVASKGSRTRTQVTSGTLTASNRFWDLAVSPSLTIENNAEDGWSVSSTLSALPHVTSAPNATTAAPATTTAPATTIDTVINVTLLLRISGTNWSEVLTLSYAAVLASVVHDLAISLNVSNTSVVIHSLSVGSLIVNSSVDAAALTVGGVVSTSELSSPTTVQTTVQARASNMALTAVTVLYSNVTNTTNAALSLTSVSVTPTVVTTTSTPVPTPTDNSDAGIAPEANDPNAGSSSGCDSTCVGLAAGLGGGGGALLIIGGVVVYMKRSARTSDKDGGMLDHSALDAGPAQRDVALPLLSSHDVDMLQMQSVPRDEFDLI